MSEDKTLFRRVYETAVITGVSIIVASIIGSAFGFMWTKFTTMDDSIKKSTDKLEATQIVYGEAIDKNTKAIEELKLEIARTPVVSSLRPRSEAMPSEEKILPKETERIPVQETLKSFRKE